MPSINEKIVHELLIKTGSIIEKYDAIARETGRDFNIFDITRIENKEVIVCRVLAELLDPKGRHGQGAAYLKIFLRYCLGLEDEFSESELDNMRVTPEKFTDGGRPIDIVIEGGSKFIPVEVKIWADDQGDQCYDYCMYARKYDKSAKIVYLTPFGTEPSDGSKRELKDDDMVLISFNVHILEWLEKCLALPDTIRKTPIREILIQFISSIKKITSQLEDRPKMDIVKILSENEKTMRNAKYIADNLESCRLEMIKKFFDAFDERFTKIVKLEKISTVWDYDKTKEGIFEATYMYKREAKHDISIVFCLHAAKNTVDPLMASFGLIKTGEQKRIDKGAKEFTKYYGITGMKSSDMYICYHYITFENEQINLVDFRNGNYENYFKLFDSNKFDQIVDATVEQAKEVIAKINQEVKSNNYGF